MQRIMEPIFEVAYLLSVVTFGVLILIQAKKQRQYVLFGSMALVLGFGDAFHLVPRMWALIESGSTALPQYAVALGFGKAVTSLTMTAFYVMLYEVWRMRYKAEHTAPLTILVYLLSLCRMVLCALPQNQWLSMDAPLEWGIYRNIPFVALGLLIIVLFLYKALKQGDKPFQWMWLAIVLSFAFYIPVVLFADIYPTVGLLMIPKTCAYMWIVVMGYLACKVERKVLA